jgi:hypothetical protein
MPRRDKVLDSYYKTSYWKRRRLLQLKEQPLCALCLAETPPRTTPATTVDHVVPFTDWNSFVLSELRSLCAYHHYSAVQYARNRGYARVRIGIDGYPIPNDPPSNSDEQGSLLPWPQGKTVYKHSRA